MKSVVALERGHEVKVDLVTGEIKADEARLGPNLKGFEAEISSREREKRR